MCKNQPKLRWYEIKEFKYLYVYKGWNQQHLSRKYKIHPSSALYWIKKLKLERKVPKLLRPPKEIRHLYKSKRPKVKRYKDYLKEDQDRIIRYLY